uniref:NADH-ubiquinone oxidoreductase chain 4L n=1 Tax=Symphurus orientalis TaxID=665865 RepID=A0A0K0Q622_9PLEU|nr:NADH dehydrogenase subunit 4L [Symphurus orientalis]
MIPNHFAFSCAFMTALMGLTLHRQHLLSALLCLESLMLCLFVGLTLWALQFNIPASSTLPLLLLALSACEAGTGLALMVATARTHGSDLLRNLDLLRC